MLSLVRSGPTIIKVRARHSQQKLAEAIGRYSVDRTDVAMESYDAATEGDTLIFLFSQDRASPQTYQTTQPATALLADIIRRSLCDEVLDLKITPPNIFMRLIGDHIDSAIDRVAKDFKAREAAANELLDYMEEDAALLNFTGSPLNRIVHIKDFHPRALLIDKPYGRLLVYLRSKAQEYLNIAMGSPDWNEIHISLFDAMDQFNLHYQRLICVLQGLDIGIVSGESWEPEYTIALRKSEVYQIRLLTPFPPQELKQICLGLEYGEDGRRIVDFDVYFDKKKISWISEKKLNYPKLTRPEVGVICRKNLLARLPGEARAYLEALGEQINSSDNPRNRL